MTIFARLIIAEEDGVRRFLYPMNVEIPFRKNETLLVAVKDEEGNLLPSEAYYSRGKAKVYFAVSLQPYEKRKLTIFKSELKASVPDPIQCECPEDGSVICRQERIATTLLPNSDIGSVVYDGIEHLAAPITFTLNAEQPDEDVVRLKSSGRELTFQASAKRYYEANDRFCQTDIALTACKSWVEIQHMVEEPAAGSVISLDIPLAPPTDLETPVCDFGLGNGVYSKIDGDGVMLEADFYGKKPYCCWQVSRLTEGIQRIDYQGDAVTIKMLAQRLYFHWILPQRSIAVVMTQLPPSISHFQAILGRSGRLHISVVLGEAPVRRATIGAVLHFLNDVPAAAAATNPASIVSPPKIIIKT
jgi:hypothetical protein